MPACWVRCSTTTACCGSPARRAFTAASTTSPKTWRSSTRPAGTASTASRSRPTATLRRLAARPPYCSDRSRKRPGGGHRAAHAGPGRARRRLRYAGAHLGHRGSSGQISRYSPQSGEWEAWEVPAESSRPYAILVDDRDVAWLSDMGSNEVHVFDTTQGGIRRQVPLEPRRRRGAPYRRRHQRGLAARVGAQPHHAHPPRLDRAVLSHTVILRRAEGETGGPSNHRALLSITGWPGQAGP
jgi:hypothetical protein